MTPPSRQDDEDVRAPALSRAVCVAVQVVAVGRVRWRLFYRQLGVFLPAPLLDRLLVERVLGDLADSTRQLARDAALLLLLLLLSNLDLFSVATRRIETVGSRNRTLVSPWLVDATEHAFDLVQTASVESFHAVSLVPVRPVKCNVSSLTDLVSELAGTLCLLARRK